MAKKKIDNIGDAIIKDLGGGVSYGTSRVEHYKNMSWLDSGNFTLNKVINYQGKGIPAANMVEIFGASTSGKSVTGLHVVRSTQEQDGVAIYIDSEGSLNPKLAQDTGVDLRKLIILEPTIDDDLNQLTWRIVVKRVESIIRTVRRQYGKEKLLSIVWDSLGGTPTDSDVEGEEAKLSQGLPERLLKRGLARVIPIVNKTNTLWLVINQVFSQPGQFISEDKSPGGKAVKFFSEVRIKCILKSKSKSRIMDGNVPRGARLHYEVVKNRVGPPFGTGFSEFYFKKDGTTKLDYYSGYANYLLDRGYVESGKGKLIVGEDTYRKKNVGEYIQCDYMEKMLEEHPELLKV